MSPKWTFQWWSWKSSFQHRPKRHEIGWWSYVEECLVSALLSTFSAAHLGTATRHITSLDSRPPLSHSIHRMPCTCFSLSRSSLHHKIQEKTYLLSYRFYSSQQDTVIKDTLSSWLLYQALHQTANTFNQRNNGSVSIAVAFNLRHSKNSFTLRDLSQISHFRTNQSPIM